MDIRKLTDTFSVAPQILPHEMTELAALGYKTIICNRPDMEIEPDLQRDAMRQAAESAGLVWCENVIISGAMTMDNVLEQGRCTESCEAPVLAYCRSGTRSATAWALSQAGKMPTQDIISAAANGGYDLSMMASQIDQLAAAG